MDTRLLGQTGLKVTRLGFGSSEIGRIALDAAGEAEASQLLNTALDGGIAFFDTAACYDNSEELIGRSIAHRRQEFVLATKCGHVAGGYVGQDWTAQTITDSIERSLKRLRTDHLDLVQLHSCSVDVLKKGEAYQALLAAKMAGKTLHIGYSGDNDAAQWAVESGLFETLQTSFNLVDQSARTRLFPLVTAKGMGLIIKRPIANAAWGVGQSPRSYADGYFKRGQEMEAKGPIPSAPQNRILLSLGFTLAHEAVDTVIVGARNPDHVIENIDLLATGLPLAPEAIAELHRRYDQTAKEWSQLT